MNAKTLPFFCADCDAELDRSGADSKRQRDGRVICKKCMARLRERERSRQQGDLFIEQKSLFNPNRRRNLAGFTDDSGRFRPIRASKDYNEFLAGDYDTEKQQQRREIRKSEREHDESRKRREFYEAQERKEQRGQPREKVRSLSQFVRSMGGIAYWPGVMYAGEIRRLSPKESGTTGLINQHARQGSYRQTAEYVMEAANTEGFRDEDGQPYGEVGAFLHAVELDARRRGPGKHKRKDTRKQRDAKIMAKATAHNPKRTASAKREAIYKQVREAIATSQMLERQAREAYARGMDARGRSLERSAQKVLAKALKTEKRLLTSGLAGPVGRLPNARQVWPVPEYRVKLNSNGSVDWQHRLEPELGGGVYKRNYPSVTDWQHDIADKFGGRFAARVARELKKRKRNGFFDSDAVARAKPVTRVRRVKEKGTGEVGEILSGGPKGWLKVKWANRDKPTLVKRSEVALARRSSNPGQQRKGVTRHGFKLGDVVTDSKGKRGYIFSWVIGKSARDPNWVRIVFEDNSIGDRSIKKLRKVNPIGLIDLASNLQAADYLLQKAGPKKRSKKKNPKYKGLKTVAPTPKAAREIIAEAKDYLNRTWDGTETENRAFHQLVSAYEVAGFSEARARDAATRELNKKRKTKKNPSDPIHRLALEGIHYVNTDGKGARFLKQAIANAETHRASLSGKERQAATKLILHAKRELRRRGQATAKQNPSVQAIAEKFQGRASGAVREYKAASVAPSNLARLGKLVLIVVEGRTIRIPGAMACVDTKEKLWIVGNRAPLFTVKAKPGQRINYGFIDRIVYDTAKAHIGNGKRYEYDHHLGEDGGRKPELHVDHEGMPVIVGGDYKITKAGIVN